MKKQLATPVESKSSPPPAEPAIIGRAEAFQKVLRMLDRVAPTDRAVLISGPTGSGKEVLAQLIHHRGRGPQTPFQDINCGALPEHLVEAELFGYAKGAFTGAVASHAGHFERVGDGTLFLDEIGELPLALQPKLLRVLETRSFRRLGSAEVKRFNGRIVAASHRNLEASVREGTFREDLYYRCSEVTVRIPPLRERRDDIPLLIAHFLREQNEKFGTNCKGLTPEALEAACAYAWPGTIRQLRNVIEAALTIESGSYIGLPALSQFIVTGQPGQFSTQADYEAALARFETEYLIRLLRKHAGNVEAAAAEAGMNMATVYRKLKKYGIRRKEID
jgi:transcriptional regulator with PAS, ATPase and Fis domain